MKKILVAVIVIGLIGIFFAKGPIVSLFSQKRPTLSEFSDLISVSQIGFKPEDEKSAVLGMNARPELKKFSILDLKGNKVYEGNGRSVKTKFRGNTLLFVFDKFEKPGTYYIESNGLQSPSFVIDKDVWKKFNVDNTFDSFFVFQRQRDEIEGESNKTYLEADRDLPVYVLDEKGKESSRGDKFADATGGWYDATSTDKETVKIGWAAQNLLLAYETNPAVFSKKGDSGLEKVLEEARYGLEYLFKIQDKDGGVFLAVKPYDWWVKGALPRRILVNKCTGVTAKVVAAWATAYRVFKDKDPVFAQECFSRARKGWMWISDNPNSYIMDKAYPGYWTGKVSSVLWAATELYISTKEPYPKEAQVYKEKAADIIKNSEVKKGVWKTKLGPYATSALATVIEEPAIFAYARMYPYLDVKLKKRVERDLLSWFRYWKASQDKAYGVALEAMKPWFGMNGWVMQIGMAAMVVGDASGREDIIKFGKDQVQWVLGDNPFGMSFVVGYGTDYHRYPFKRPLDKSIGGVVPGIIDKNKDGIPENVGPYEGQTDECTLDGGGFLVWDIALLDKLVDNN